MNTVKQKHKKKTGKITQLKAANKVLNKEIKTDKASLVKLKEEISFEKRFRESQHRFETIFYKSKLGNKIIGPDFEILQINEVLQQMLGYRAEEIIGTKITSYAHPDFISHWHELQDSLWNKQIPSFQIDTCLIRKDGSSMWCQVISILFQDNEQDLGYTIVEDISERKALEQNLHKLYDYQETILHMVAHDLKSPLNNIKLLNDYLKENVEMLTAEKVETKEDSFSFIQMIQESCSNAFAIIQDLLLIGEFKSNEAFEKTDLKIFITSLLAQQSAEAQKKGIKINFQYPDTPVYAHLNQDKFTRVLENLLSNAVKFTNVGGQVTISLKNKGQRVLLQVSDTGIGIPQNLQATIFNKFTKANRKGTEGEATTGLGLYIVKQIVEIHKGKIWVESQENTGTSFFMELI